MPDAAGRLDELRREAEAAVRSASSTAELEDLRVRYLGRKSELTGVLRGIGERVRRTDHRPNVPRVRHAVQVDAHVPAGLRPHLREDADHARARTERAHPVQEPRLHVLARDQQELGLEPGGPRRLDQVLALGHAQARALAVTLVVEPLYGLDAGVVF